MNSTPVTLLVPLVVWLLSCTAASADDPQGPMVPQADLDKIRTAAPYESPALPKGTRKLLVFSRLTGYQHKSVPWGAQAFRILGEKSGAYAALLGDDPAMFDRGRLDQFDAVLISLDTRLTDMNVPDVVRKDGDFGLAWIRGHGKGRVFYSALGHQKDIYWDPAILKHYLAGIQFAPGDLQADTTPNPKQ